MEYSIAFLSEQKSATAQKRKCLVDLWMVSVLRISFEENCFRIQLSHDAYK